LKEKKVLYIPDTIVEQPIIYGLIKNYNLMVNILRANINPEMEGRIVAEISGEKEDFLAGMAYLQSRAVKCLPLEQEIVWLEERCTQCGACSVICPAGALELERPEMIVRFKGEKCIICEHCIGACPARAMELRY
jgi:ferredoxin